MKIQFESVSFSRIPRIKTLCNSQKGAGWGRQRGNLAVLGNQTVPGREKKWSDVLGYLSELAWKGPTWLKLATNFPEENLSQSLVR